jgi:hypothetical protein
VREAHKRVDPTLESVTGNPEHLVACLLDSGVRKQLWSELRAGKAPAEARELVIEEGAA